MFVYVSCSHFNLFQPRVFAGKLLFDIATTVTTGRTLKLRDASTWQLKHRDGNPKTAAHCDRMWKLTPIINKTQGIGIC